MSQLMLNNMVLKSKSNPKKTAQVVYWKGTYAGITTDP